VVVIAGMLMLALQCGGLAKTRQEAWRRFGVVTAGLFKRIVAASVD
jgi:hypothetical protein